MTLQGLRFAGTGSFAPAKILTNDDLSKIVDTTDEWIVSRTGIRERHVAGPEETTSFMAAEAARRALEAAGWEASSLNLIIVATLTPDKPFPNTASLVQARIGATGAACFSLEAACTGFVYSLEVAAGMIRSGLVQRALIIGAEKLTSIVNWADRNTCVLFGDGAGAVCVEACPDADNSYLGSSLGSDGNFHDLLHTPIGGCAEPLTADNASDPRRYLVMEGKQVFNIAVRSMVSAAERALTKAGLAGTDLDLLIPHQANLRIIEAIAERVSTPRERVYVNLDRYGNTSAASIPIAFDEAVRNGRVKRGDKVLFVGFGGGFTYGASVVRY